MEVRLLKGRINHELRECLVRVETQNKVDDDSQPTIDLIIIADESSSMRPHMNIVKETVRGILEVISTDCSKDSKVGIVGFADSARVVRDLKTASCDEKICTPDLQARGNTNIMSGIRLAQRMFDESEVTNRVYILFSDGFPTVGLSGPNIIDAVRSLPSFSNSSFMTLCVGRTCDFSLMHKLASYSAGGTMFEILTFNGVSAAIGALLGLAMHQTFRKTRIRITSPGNLWDYSRNPIPFIDKTFGHVSKGESRELPFIANVNSSVTISYGYEDLDEKSTQETFTTLVSGDEVKSTTDICTEAIISLQVGSNVSSQDLDKSEILIRCLDIIKESNVRSAKIIELEREISSMLEEDKSADKGIRDIVTRTIFQRSTSVENDTGGIDFPDLPSLARGVSDRVSSKFTQGVPSDLAIPILRRQ